MNEARKIRGIADTARWVAMYRATESARPDAHFKDPYARLLAGPQGEDILRDLPKPMRNAAWSVIARTVQVDRYILAEIAAGTRMVINLAAGLDTRPYRLQLPPDLLWIEVDQVELLAEKSELLKDAVPGCRLERVAQDLTNEAERHALFSRLNAEGRRALIVTEGLIMYLPEPAVASLARELASHSNFHRWATDVISPRLLQLIDASWGKVLRAGNSPMQFAPETPRWFESLGWRVIECRSSLVEAGRLKRLPWLMRLFARLPGADRFQPKRPWSGCCLLEVRGER